MQKTKLNFNKLFLLFILFSSTSLLLQSCISDDDYEDQRSIDNRLILKYLSDNDIDAEKDESGYYYEVIESNTSGSEVKDEDILSVYYKMNLLSGKKIDSLVNGTDQPAKFKITNKSLIPVGLRFGSSKMKEGEKFRFFIPSHLAYADYSYEDLFQANSIFIVESEIVKIETEEEQKTIDKDSIDDYITENSIEDIERLTSGLYYKRVTEGEGDKPVDGKTVKIQFVAKYLNGATLDSTKVDDTFSFKIGSNTVIKGLDEGVKLMQKGEKATLLIPSHLAYDESLQIFPEIVREDLLEKELIIEETPPFSILKFEVELVEIL